MRRALIQITDKQLREAQKGLRFVLKVYRNTFDYGVDPVTGRIDMKKLPQSEGESRKSYCDSLAHCTLVEDHQCLLACEQMTVLPRRRIALARLSTPLMLSGDIKVAVHLVNLTSDTCYFVWFNTNFVTDQYTSFTGAEVDCSKSTQGSSASYSSWSSSSSMDAASDLYSVVTEGDESTHALSHESSTRSLLPPVDPDTDTSSLLRLYFQGKGLRDSIESKRMREAVIKESDTLSQAPLKPMALLHKASSQLIHSTRSLISRVSSGQPGPSALSRTLSEGSMSGRSCSSRDREPDSPRTTSPIPDAEVTIPEIVFRDRHEIEKRERMRMSKLNESEEFMQSVNSNFSEHHFKNHELDAINEGDDEIRLDSDSTCSLSDSSTEIPICHVCFSQSTNVVVGETDYWPRSG